MPVVVSATSPLKQASNHFNRTSQDCSTTTNFNFPFSKNNFKKKYFGIRKHPKLEDIEESKLSKKGKQSLRKKNSNVKKFSTTTESTKSIPSLDLPHRYYNSKIQSNQKKSQTDKGKRFSQKNITHYTRQNQSFPFTKSCELQTDFNSVRRRKNDTQALNYVRQYQNFVSSYNFDQRVASSMRKEPSRNTSNTNNNLDLLPVCKSRKLSHEDQIVDDTPVKEEKNHNKDKSRPDKRSLIELDIYLNAPYMNEKGELETARNCNNTQFLSSRMSKK
eukprot:gb/GECH01014947.1/.p1 GENE.gb/GECH01014947.1/~~gb/GECH01014947.1/.p1  ORF type:complete len:275 (+),score=54.77 gb/GECH01014947.1/:1-825(+)